MSSYDKRKSRQSFDRAAHRYDKSAALQQQVAAKLIALQSKEGVQSVLDIGCGTGQVTAAMCVDYPQANIVALDFAERMLLETEKRLSVINKSATLVCADAECLPFVDESFDLIISSLMLQWSNDLTQNLTHIHRCLMGKGQLAFSTFTEGTLKEVKASWKSVDGLVHTSDFMGVDTLKQSVEAAGFRNVQIHQETIVSLYPKVREVLMDMKRIGASNAHSDRSKGLTGKQRFAAFESAYEIFKQADMNYPCTWELAYVFGEK
ncbi:malonyl-ACP O-methyltransferase BioC [Leucothrix arctica]|uniref:malonyl-ACP O-methyltransferase BioC n=1 Tax=Leucothrix arctica TaxID=1481894 RepID=UPI001304A968|nr:malonyl-ACP O-methyltransferase BioC [Leucothrix arctica]